VTGEPAGGMGAINLLDVRVDLGGRPILRGISLSVARGEWVTVIGPNGAGKSTLLRAIGGTTAYTGLISVLGERRERLSPRERARRLATVAQQPVVPVGMTVLDYVLLGRTPYISPLGRESTVDLIAVEEVLDRLSLVDFVDRRVETLSGGERQRVFLARALAQGAPVLLLDEPTAALDIGHQQEVLDLIDRLRVDSGLTVLATMHDLSLAGEYADRMVLLADGLAAAAGTPAEVLTEASLSRYYGARVRVVDGEYGPLVVPVRPADRTGRRTDPVS
jgi:iron complex transport system ATP-binding protein